VGICTGLLCDHFQFILCTRNVLNKYPIDSLLNIVLVMWVFV